MWQGRKTHDPTGTRTQDLSHTGQYVFFSSPVTIGGQFEGVIQGRGEEKVLKTQLWMWWNDFENTTEHNRTKRVFSCVTDILQKSEAFWHFLSLYNVQNENKRKHATAFDTQLKRRNANIWEEKKEKFLTKLWID